MQINFNTIDDGKLLEYCKMLYSYYPMIRFAIHTSSAGGDGAINWPYGMYDFFSYMKYNSETSSINCYVSKDEKVVRALYGKDFSVFQIKSDRAKFDMHDGDYALTISIHSGRINTVEIIGHNGYAITFYCTDTYDGAAAGYLNDKDVPFIGIRRTADDVELTIYTTEKFNITISTYLEKPVVRCDYTSEDEVIFVGQIHSDYSRFLNKLGIIGNKDVLQLIHTYTQDSSGGFGFDITPIVSGAVK